MIARDGFRHASFARIAKHAGLSSTRLISYHFAGKDELIQVVSADVIASIGDYMARRLAIESSAAGLLRAYIEGMVEFIVTYRAPMKALLEIFLSGGLRYDPPTEQVVCGHVETILRRGQVDGAFREFDSRLVATAVHGTVEGLPFMVVPLLDLASAAFWRI